MLLFYSLGMHRVGGPFCMSILQRSKGDNWIRLRSKKYSRLPCMIKNVMIKSNVNKSKIILKNIIPRKLAVQVME